MKKLISLVLAVFMMASVVVFVPFTATAETVSGVASVTDAAGKTTGYDSLQAALNAVTDGGTVTLLENVNAPDATVAANTATQNAGFFVKNNAGTEKISFTIDGNGKTITSTYEPAGVETYAPYYAMMIEAPGATVTVKDLTVNSLTGGINVHPGSGNGENAYFENVKIYAGGTYEGATEPAYKNGVGMCLGTVNTRVEINGADSTIVCDQNVAVLSYGTAVLNDGYYFSNSDDTVRAQTGSPAKAQQNQQLFINGGTYVNTSYSVVRALNGAAVFITGGEFLLDVPADTAGAVNCVRSSWGTTSSSNNNGYGFVYIYGGSFYSNALSRTVLGRNDGSAGVIKVNGGKFYSACDSTANFSNEAPYDWITTDKTTYGFNAEVGTNSWSNPKYECSSNFGFKAEFGSKTSNTELNFKVEDKDGNVLAYTDCIIEATVYVTDGGKITVQRDITDWHNTTANTVTPYYHHSGETYTIEGNNKHINVDVPGYYVLIIRSGNVTINNLKMSNNTGTEYAARDMGRVFQTQELGVSDTIATLNNCTLTAGHGAAIYVNSNTTINANNCTIESQGGTAISMCNNSTLNITGCAVTGSTNGINVAEDHTAATINANNCTIVAQNGTAISPRTDSIVNVTGCTVTGSKNGILVASGSTAVTITVRDCTVTGETEYGLYGRQKSVLKVYNSEINSTKSAGIQMITAASAELGARLEIYPGTVVRTSGAHAVNVNPYNSVVIYGGSFYSSGGDTALNAAGAGSTAVVYDGYFENNKICAVRAHTGGVIDIYGGTFNSTVAYNSAATYPGAAVYCGTNGGAGTVNIYGGRFISAAGPVINGYNASAVANLYGGIYEHTGENDAKVLENTNADGEGTPDIEFAEGEKTYRFPATPEIKAYQTTDVEGGKYSIRFVGVIDTLDCSAGLKITAEYTEDGVVKTKEWDQKITTVYGKINANGEVKTEVTAAELKGSYIFAVTVAGIPADVGEVTFTVTPYSTTELTENRCTGNTTVTAYTPGFIQVS